MNKDLENVIKEVGNEIWAHTYCWEIDSLIHHSQDKVDSLVKYRDYTIAQIIELTRIERLFDLKLIDLQTRKTLLKEYKEYIELCSKIFGFELDQFTGKISKDEKLDKNFYLRKQELERKLKSFGILGDFNFEKAILDGIDKELEKNETAIKVARVEYVYPEDPKEIDLFCQRILDESTKLGIPINIFHHGDIPDEINNQDDIKKK